MKFHTIKKGLSVWGRLLRLPNLFTIPGDVIVGAAWGGGGKFTSETGWAVLAVLFIYCGGLLLNDYFDREIDLKQSPQRPIPSGEISERVVLVTGCAALLIGVFIALWGIGWRAGIAAAMLSVFVLLYDCWLKLNKVFGPVLMGFCRGSAVIVGSLAGGAALVSPSLLVAVVIILYVTVVTLIASQEHKGVRPGKIAYIPVLIVAMGIVLLSKLVSISFISLIGYSLFVLACIEGVWAALQVNSGRSQVPVFIGRLIRLMIVIQAAWTIPMFDKQRIVVVLGVLVMFVALKIGAEMTAHRFYAS